MKIEFGSKWQHKDGGIYEVADVGVSRSDSGRISRKLVWYKDQQGEIYVRTEKHFLASFKPYEPVYEYKWAYKYNDYEDAAFSFTYKYCVDEQEAREKSSSIDRSDFNFYRIDGTKRERK